MNWIVLEDFEKNESSQYLLDSNKSAHVKNILGKKIGDSIKVILPSISKGYSRILSFPEDKVLIDKPTLGEKPHHYEINKLSEKMKVLSKVRLILPLPRPQTGKKILHLIGCFGVAQVVFLLPQSHNKQFLTSPVYKTSGIWNEIKTGMEQSGSFLVPKVQIVHLNLKEYLERSKVACKISLDPSMEDSFYDLETFEYVSRQEEIGIEVYFGSESGNSLEDIDLLSKMSKCYSLGDTILRSEYAIANVLGILKSKG